MTYSQVMAVIVTYQPNMELLESVVHAVASQVGFIYIVDNGSDLPIHDSLFISINKRLELNRLERNSGIAYAQNLGIEFARQKGYQFVLLMDQDSVPVPDMVSRLLAVAGTGANFASAGPRYLDFRQENPPPFISINGLSLVRHACKSEQTVVPVDYLISSGCLIPVAVIEHVGGMREDLFIDYVDIEWGLRAQAHGYQNYGVCGAKMSHSLGDEPIDFFGKKIPLHSPLRHYYHFRNAILLYRESWVPWNWKVVDGWRLLLKYGFYTLFAKPRWQQFRMMSTGILHGLLGKSGQYDPSP